jgi:hypothetical protein
MNACSRDFSAASSSALACSKVATVTVGLPPARGIHQRRDIPADEIVPLGMAHGPREAVVRHNGFRPGNGNSSIADDLALSHFQPDPAHCGQLVTIRLLHGVLPLGETKPLVDEAITTISLI